MALYDITFLTKEEADPGVKDLISQLGGEVTEESTLGRRRLAYPIKKETQAVYTSFGFNFEPAGLAELNRRLSLNTQVMRFLLTTKPVERVDKEMSKTVREAIAAAEKLDDTIVEPEVTAELPVEEPVVESIPIEVEAEVEVTPDATEAPVKKPRAKKAVEKPVPAPETAVEATEEDRLKALEDKLGEILKD